jgi:hypothetical protein
MLQLTAMNTKVYSNEDFDAVLPESWIVEEDEGIISLYNPEDGVGALQFSVFSVASPSNIALKKN